MHTILLFIAVVLNVGAQLFLKYAAQRSTEGKISFAQFKSLAFNYLFWGAILLYGLSFLLYTIVLTKFELSRAYPISSLSAIFLLVLVSLLFFHEPLTIYKFAGLLASAAGIILLFR